MFIVNYLYIYIVRVYYLITYGSSYIVQLLVSSH